MAAKKNVTRRQFIQTATATAGAAMFLKPSLVKTYAANESLNFALIGVGGKGASHIGWASGAGRIVAICDADKGTLAKVGEKFTDAKQYTDYRKLFEEVKGLNAAVVATPDHHHCNAAMRAVMQGCSVYVEKPLTYSIGEARLLRDAVNKHKVASQMGNQGHSTEHNRQTVEFIQAGLMGEVTEVHTWTNRPVWPQGQKPQAVEPPKDLDFESWIGPRPKTPMYKAGGSLAHPFNWRGYWNFGTGALGDMGCHTFDAPYWALNLGGAEELTVISETESPTDEMYPAKAKITYSVPARGDLKPVKVVWYSGGWTPEVTEDMGGRTFKGSGTLYVGTKHKMMTQGDYGSVPRLIPDDLNKGLVRPAASIPRSPKGHTGDFIAAAKGGDPASSNFNYGAGLTEFLLIGAIAERLPGKELKWNAKAMQFTNSDEATQFVPPAYRDGWQLG